MRIALLISFLLGLAACVPAIVPVAGGPETLARDASTAAADATSSFLAVIAAVEPVAERLCRQRGPAGRCDFKIVIDDRPDQPPNAFQTVDTSGRPVLGFTLALIDLARNADELAFVLGHEAAHHIAGHIPIQRKKVQSDKRLAGIKARADGLSPEEVKAAQDQAAAAAKGSFSQGFELEADAIGAEIALVAGFDPVRGAGFFDRLPDPVNGFRSTHPPHSRRKALVLATVASLGG